MAKRKDDPKKDAKYYIDNLDNPKAYTEDSIFGDRGKVAGIYNRILTEGTPEQASQFLSNADKHSNYLLGMRQAAGDQGYSQHGIISLKGAPENPLRKDSPEYTSFLEGRGGLPLDHTISKGDRFGRRWTKSHPGIHNPNDPNYGKNVRVYEYTPASGDQVRLPQDLWSGYLEQAKTQGLVDEGGQPIFANGGEINNSKNNNKSIQIDPRLGYLNPNLQSEEFVRGQGEIKSYDPSFLEKSASLFRQNVPGSWRSVLPIVSDTEDVANVIDQFGQKGNIKGKVGSLGLLALPVVGSKAVMDVFPKNMNRRIAENSARRSSLGEAYKQDLLDWNKHPQTTSRFKDVFGASEGVNVQDRQLANLRSAQNKEFLSADELIYDPLGEVAAYYNPTKHTSFYPSSFSFNKFTPQNVAIHENTHAMLGGDINDVYKTMINKNLNSDNPFLKQLEDSNLSLDEATKLRNDYKYLTDPGEVYSRINEIRFSENLKPGVPITSKRLERSVKNMSESGREDLNKLLDIYGSEHLSKLINTLPAVGAGVYIGRKIDNNNTMKFANGGTISQYNLGGWIKDNKQGVLGGLSAAAGIGAMFIPGLQGVGSSLIASGAQGIAGEIQGDMAAKQAQEQAIIQGASNSPVPTTQSFPFGGLIPYPNAEIEQDEVFRTPDGNIGVVKGDSSLSHSNGGVKANFPAGTEVLGKNVDKQTNMTFKEIGQKIAKEKKKLQNLKEQTKNKFTQNSVKAMEQKLNNEFSEVFNRQEATKGNSFGKGGSIDRYQDGGVISGVADYEQKAIEKAFDIENMSDRQLKRSIRKLSSPNITFGGKGSAMEINYKQRLVLEHHLNQRSNKGTKSFLNNPDTVPSRNLLDPTIRREDANTYEGTFEGLDKYHGGGLTGPDLSKNPIAMDTTATLGVDPGLPSVEQMYEDTGAVAPFGKFAPNLEGFGNSLAQIAPIGYNLFQGLSKPEQEVLPQQFNQANALLANRQYNIDPVLEANRTAQAIGDRNLIQSGAGAGAVRAGRLGNLSARMRSDLQARSQQSNIENQYLGEQAQGLFNTGRMQLGVDQANLQNEAARRAFLGQAATQVSDLAQRNVLEENLKTRDKQTLEIYKKWLPMFSKQFGDINFG